MENENFVLSKQKSSKIGKKNELLTEKEKMEIFLRPCKENVNAIYTIFDSMRSFMCLNKTFYFYYIYFRIKTLNCTLKNSTCKPLLLMILLHVSAH